MTFFGLLSAIWLMSTYTTSIKHKLLSRTAILRGIDNCCYIARASLTGDQSKSLLEIGLIHEFLKVGVRNAA